ncbi:MAG: DUF3048 domain-containing protein [Christensenellales bacterium]
MRNRIVAAALLAAMVFSMAGCKKIEQDEPSVTPVPTVIPSASPTPEPEPKTVSPITGLAWDEDLPFNPIAVMVENHVDARPQSGLSKADLVYEAYVEGEITRFMAIYMSEFPQKVGPVRSSRVYYLDWVAEWDPIYVHYGGSQPKGRDDFNIYSKIGTMNIRDRVDGMTDSGSITRDSSRQAPHNAYADLTKIAEKGKDGAQAMKAGFAHTKSVSGGDAATGIDIAYSQLNQNILRYEYNPKSGTYDRFVMDEPFTDRETGGQITAKNIIVQKTTHSGVGINALIDLKAIGSGECIYFMDGQAFEGSWEKKSRDEATVYYDTEGEIMQFLPGNIWVQVVSGAATVHYQ